MDIAGGYHQFVHLLAQSHNLPVKLPQGLLTFGHRLLPFFLGSQHKSVVGDGLHFQVIVEGGDPLQFLLGTAVQHRLEQFIIFAGRADNQTFPGFEDLRFEDPGEFPEVLQIGLGDQPVEVSKTQLVLGKEDNVLTEVVLSTTPTLT